MPRSAAAAFRHEGGASDHRDEIEHESSVQLERKRTLALEARLMSDVQSEPDAWAAVAIEDAQMEDAEALLALQRVAYRSEAALYDAWDIPPLVQNLASLREDLARQVVLVATLADPDGARRIVGSVRARLAGGTCHIGRLIVHPEHQGRGIGTQLMHAIEARYPQAERYELFTGHLSEGNLRLYVRLGYTLCREERMSRKLTLLYLEKRNAPLPDEE
jgi:GNAT superfamily N-acetyltransferase